MTKVNMDWTVPAETPGVRVGTIVAATHEVPLSKDPRIVLDFELDGGGSVRDWVMLAGNGKGMGVKKLERLGVPKGKAFDTDDLIGKRITLVLVLDEYQGRSSLKVDAKANTEPYALGYGELLKDGEAPADLDDPDKVPF